MSAGARSGALGGRQYRGSDPLAAGARRDCHPAQASDVSLDEHPAGADHAALAIHGHDLDRAVVQPVAVGRKLHSLLDAEDLLAQREGLLDLVT
jgi:hypothetical protein